jgi:hypothetical protein
MPGAATGVVAGSADEGALAGAASAAGAKPTVAAPVSTIVITVSEPTVIQCLRIDLIVFSCHQWSRLVDRAAIPA